MKYSLTSQILVDKISNMFVCLCLYFVFMTGCLSALVYQHAITPLALPCKLLIPTTGLLNKHMFSFSYISSFTSPFIEHKH